MLQQQLLLQHQQQQLKQQEAQVQVAQGHIQSTQPQQQQQGVQPTQASAAQVPQAVQQQEVMSSETSPPTVAVGSASNHVASKATPTAATTATEFIWGAKRTNVEDGESAKSTYTYTLQQVC